MWELLNEQDRKFKQELTFENIYKKELARRRREEKRRNSI
ncbi:MAG: hypothetical protein BWY24_00674 [Microgenomates group bacterium ADurb.Bin219]|nr:MAG: hypothetical protein BWY24_00674 [Microgenomates group bacterium ADurb.Bin219]